MFTFDLSPRSPLSVSSSPPAEEWEWVAGGIDEAAIVQGFAQLNIPNAISTPNGILYRQDVKLNRQGHELYYVTAPYAPRDKNKWTWNGDTSGGTFTIKASKQHIASYVPAGEVAKDHKGAIGRQLDGTIDGVPIVIPAGKFDVSVEMPYGIVTPSYFRFIRSLTGKVNNAPIFGFPAGEILLLGGRMSDGSEAPATVSLSFAVEENLQNLIVGGITVASKDGHDYAWIEFKLDADGANLPISKPCQIDVCRVYDRIDLAAALGIGG
jgi:hypothetical protein